MSRHFPFHALGLRCNPFRVLTDAEWGDIAWVPPEALAVTGHMQILGALGHGKTTLLLGLAAQFRRAGQRAVYEYLPEGQTHFEMTTDGLDVFLLDEAQRLSARERRRLLKTSARLVLGSHADLTPFFAHAGLALATVRLETVSTEQYHAILERRLAYFAIARPRFSFSADAVSYLLETCGGNLRAAELRLYEFFQQLPPPGEITRRQLQSAARPAPG